MCVQNQQTHFCLCRKLLLLKTAPQVLASVPASGLREVGPRALLAHCPLRPLGLLWVPVQCHSKPSTPRDAGVSASRRCPLWLEGLLVEGRASPLHSPPGTGRGQSSVGLRRWRNS